MTSSVKNKRKILVFIDWFEPAYKAGGPIQSVKNLVQSIQTLYDVYIFTSDRDLGDRSPMGGIIVDRWIDYGNEAHVFYSSPAKLNWKDILNVLTAIEPDFIYCNSLFSKYFSIYPLMMKRFGKVKSKLILSPKGMLRPSALKFKPVKKKIFLTVFKFLQVPSYICFHATDMEEGNCIKREFGEVTVSCILDSPGALPSTVKRIVKDRGYLKLLFVGRVHPIKQLDYLLHLLDNNRANIMLTIVGVIEDHAYWAKCREQIAAFPTSISVNYIGEQSHNKLADIISQHHLLVLPTLGENFGHVIYEALAAGRPALISDQTPWKNLLECKAGWDYSLGQTDKFLDALAEAVNWNQQTYDEWSDGARFFVENYLKNTDLLTAYKQLFN